MDTRKGNVIVELTFKFALDIIEFVEKLEADRKFVISNQLLRAGTSIGAGVREAQNAESKSDFIHKLKIAAKEADETEYWLLLCKSSRNYQFSDHLIEQIHSITKILTKIISSSKNNV
ncbi:MAG: four helix bundle protein [Bacteroidetes bacterium]|nr:four helix bundle protein [Bacteroidota bacterium]